VVDQGSKYLAVSRLKDHAPISLLGDYFELYYLENHGAAWGILSGKTVFLVLLSIVVLLVLIWIYFKIPVQPRYVLLQTALLLVASGAVGNMIDRIRNQYVIDFFYVKAIDFPVFNVADIYVTVGAFLLIIALLFVYEEKELSFWKLFSK
jgi:signal peptidase II